jgi:hypothetical protein
MTGGEWIRENSDELRGKGTAIFRLLGLPPFNSSRPDDQVDESLFLVHLLEPGWLRTAASRRNPGGDCSGSGEIERKREILTQG